MSRELEGCAPAGFFAGMVTKLACAPIERVRLLYQTQGMFCKPDSAKYKNMIQSWNLIRKEEGFLALWKGNGINMLRAACAYGLKFTTNEWSLQRNRGGAGGEGKGGGGNSLGDLVTAGFTAGLVQKTITYPIDVWSVRVAMGANTKALGEQGAYRGMWDCAFRILRNEGVQGFYKGYMLTLATGIPYITAQLTLFGILKKRSQEEKGHWSQRSAMRVLWESVIAGALANLCAQFLVFPADTVRKRMMNNGVDGKPLVFKNTLDCVQKMYRDEGWRSFYRGIGPTAFKAIPAGAIQFATFELIVRFFKERGGPPWR